MKTSFRFCLGFTTTSSFTEDFPLLQRRKPQFDSWVGQIRWRRDRLPTSVFLGFPCGSAGKESACNVGDQGSIPGLGRSPGEGKGYPLQYSSLENSMGCIVHGVTKSRTRLSDFHFPFPSPDLLNSTVIISDFSAQSQSGFNSANRNYLMNF